MQTGTTIEVEKFVDDCINEYKDSESGNGLFNSKNGMFWSESFLRRMEKYEDLKEKRRQAANARWNKDEEKTDDKNNKKNAKKCKCIKGYCKSNANAKQKKYKSNAKSQKVHAKLCKLNEMKLNKIKLNEIKSIYPSDHKKAKNENLKMDRMDEMEFDRIVSNCELHLLDPALAVEIRNILREMYIDLKTKPKVEELNSKKLFYALQQFAVANTKTKIQKPKAYFEKCILTALDQTELSTQYDTETIYEFMN